MCHFVKWHIHPFISKVFVVISRQCGAPIYITIHPKRSMFSE